MNELDKKRAQFVNDRVRVLLDDVMGKNRPEFNDRTLKQYVDDSQKRLNAYVRTRAEQGKEEWQANVFTGSTRNKVRTYVGSVAKDVPLISINATGTSGERSRLRADFLKEIVRQSFVAHDNPEMVCFMDGWNCAANGTVIKHDCWVNETGKTEEIVSYDSETGKVEKKMVDAGDGVGHAVEVDVPLLTLLIGDANVVDVQEQPELAWVQFMDEAEFYSEFSNYPNFKDVSPVTLLDDSDFKSFFGDEFGVSKERKGYQVVRYYSKRMLENSKGDTEDGDKRELRSCYRIVANDTLLLDAPLLWGGRKKRYPFSKAVFEPFAKPMFYGNSLPNIIIGLQDEENALENSMLDKAHRSLETPMLIGSANRDDFDVEEREVTGSDRIYVTDVNQVKPMPVNGPTPGEFSMLERIGKLLANATSDALQSGQTGSGSTAREVVLANERASEMKGIFFLSLKDLWLQKTRLRLDSVIANYDRKNSKGTYNTVNVDNTELSNGKRGTLKLMVAEPNEISEMNRVAGYGKDRKPFNVLDVREQEEFLREGTPIEIVAIPPGYLDDYEYEIEIQTESMKQRGRSVDMALASEFTGLVARLFPNKFLANEEKFFDDLAKQYGNDPKSFQSGQPQSVSPIGEGEPSGTRMSNTLSAGAKSLEGMGTLS
jgi:rhodanese-related sulfurtransferase